MFLGPLLYFLIVVQRQTCAEYGHNAAAQRVCVNSHELWWFEAGGCVRKYQQYITGWSDGQEQPPKEQYLHLATSCAWLGSALHSHNLDLVQFVLFQSFPPLFPQYGCAFQWRILTPGFYVCKGLCAYLLISFKIYSELSRGVDSFMYSDTYSILYTMLCFKNTSDAVHSQSVQSQIFKSKLCYRNTL